MGLSCVVKVYENCRLHFPCMHKNVITVAYGKTVCGTCPNGIDSSLATLRVTGEVWTEALIL